jgi:hypothetical protein
MDPAKLVDSREFTSTGVSTLVASWIKKDCYDLNLFFAAPLNFILVVVKPTNSVVVVARKFLFRGNFCVAKIATRKTQKIMIVTARWSLF